MSLPYKLNSVLEMVDRDVSNIKVNKNKQDKYIQYTIVTCKI